MSRNKRRTYLGHPSWSPLKILTEVGNYVIIMGTFPHSPERKKYLSINVKYGSVVSGMLCGACVAGGQGLAAAHCALSTHRAPGRDWRRTGRLGPAARWQPHPHPQKFRGHRVSHVVTLWSHTGHVATCRTLGAAFLPTPWLHRCTVCTGVANIRVECSNFIWDKPSANNLVQIFTFAMAGEDSILLVLTQI